MSDPGYMIVRCHENGSIARMGGEFSRFAWLPSAGQTLPLFFLTLNIAIAGVRLRRPDLDALWVHLVQHSAPTEAPARV